MALPPIAIPASPVPPGRTSPPILAALVPVAAGFVMWLVTGSIFSLCFAALGPLMIAASLLDGVRARRRARRRAAVEDELAWARAEAELRERHEEERLLRRHRDPDAATAVLEPPFRDGHRADAETSVVIGIGARPSAVRAAGGDGERAQAFQVRCGRIEDVPITTVLGRGIALRGTSVLTAAAARALAVQLRLRFAAAQLMLVGEGLGDIGFEESAISNPPGRRAFRLGLASGGAPSPDADAVLWMLEPGDAVPDGIVCVLDIESPQSASLRTPEGVLEVRPEFFSRRQAAAAVALIPVGDEVAVLPDGLELGELVQNVSSRGLPASVGRGEGGDVVLDIVEDGPHAIVTGTTGSGKSELLVSWVTALATANGPDRVAFVLADFKGGTAFDHLRRLPQVVAVVTDLDQASSRRGVSSLSAELRRRESVLAAAGARDITEIAMPRLVIVIDEFAALLHDHPDLAAVFTDIAARGRALGMHLILGTQRAAGVVRDALAANCPLRVSLRVTDAADSRAVIGSDAAAEIAGGTSSRGIALARRPQDADARIMRVALTRPEHVIRIAERWASATPSPSPWLPPLPTSLTLDDVSADAPPGVIVLGRADDPERQEQPLEVVRVGHDRGLAIIGQIGSGRTSVVRAIAAQRPDAVLVPTDPEAAWDVVSAFAGERDEGALPQLILCDDLDARIDALPPEHAAEFAQLWERLLRTGTRTTIVVTASRAHGAIGRIIDLLPRRALLRTTGRAEHLAVGGDAEGWQRDRPIGRARIDGREVQLVQVAQEARPTARSRHTRRSTPSWRPHASVTALVTTGAAQAIEALQRDFPECAILRPSDLATSSPDECRIVVADADTWQREWATWQRIRAEGEILIRVESPADLRQLGGVRELPPYAVLRDGRAWAVEGSASVRRVVIDALRPSA
ncbi:FtsK/SpoIIIE domain-containing protein [Microbacterium sp. NPDC089695]|uniref:FtsK/SpoIIIE domain-containing protein n=1 Tax=Microbacterium sp. NPDC089695 TaxID=3364198 RepID=UPI0038062CC4